MNTLLLLAALTANFNATTGKVRPELHSSGFGPTICSQTAKDMADVKAMGFKAARTHDWALINPNQRVCDYFHIFPLPHLDAKDPNSYWFGPTDYLLKRTREETHLDVFYRLGTSIEHSGFKVHFNALVPEDFDKTAEIFAGTVRHYNRGWANGYNWGIKYWEIWNEPDGVENMWCRPEGFVGFNDPSYAEAQQELRAKFVQFYVIVLKRLKAEFGDTIKVGGPALQTYREDWFRLLFAACKKEGIAPDFISWHGYENDPMVYNRQAEQARKLCTEYGFPKCELIINEWHYFGENYNWDEMQRCSDPTIKAKIFDGPDGHNNIRGACFTLATLANMQRSKLDQAYYYGCNHTGNWGFKDAQQNLYKVFYALKMFGGIMHDYTEICASTSEGSVTTLAVKNAAGKRALLVVDYGGKARTITMNVKGVPVHAIGRVTLLDHTHNLVTKDVVANIGWKSNHFAAFAKGKLTLQKPDFNSAAFLVEFTPNNDSIAEKASGTMTPIATLPVRCTAQETVKGEAASLLPNGYDFTLVWHDEFNGTVLDATKWNYRTNFWGRRFTTFAGPEDNCVEVKDGKVHLKIKKRADGQFCSPQLQTGEIMWDVPADEKPTSFWYLGKLEKPKFVHRFGYYEARVRLQRHPGWWSAFWMQTPTQGCTLDTAQSGIEHDIMESFAPGCVGPHVFHYDGYGATYKKYCIPADSKHSLAVSTDEFHTFGLLWEPDGYSIFVDGRQDGPKRGTADGLPVSATPEFILLSTECQWYRRNRMTGKGVAELEESAKAGDDFVVDFVRVYDIVK